MFKVAGYALLWLIGSIAAVAVAWTGVAVVDDDIVPSPALPELAASDPQLESVNQPAQATSILLSPVTDAVRPSSSLATSTSGSPTSASPTSTSLTTSRTAPTAPTTSRATASSTSTTRATSSTAGATTSTTRATTSTTRATTSTTRATTSTTKATTSTSASTTVATTVPSQTKTFNLVGGSTSISFAPGATKVLWATAKPGFEVDVGTSGPGVSVEFESDTHESEIKAWWDNGPRTEISEDD